MQRKPTNFAEKLIRCDEICFPPFCLFSQQSTAERLLKFATIAVDFVDIFGPLCHLRNVALQWRRLTSQNVTKFNVTVAFLFVALNKIATRSFFQLEEMIFIQSVAK